MSKAQRQHRISSLLEEHAVNSQAQLTELLEADGIGAALAVRREGAVAAGGEMAAAALPSTVEFGPTLLGAVLVRISSIM